MRSPINDPSSSPTSKPALNLSRDMKNQGADDSTMLRGTAWTLIAFDSLSFDANKTLAVCDALTAMFPADHERWTLAQLYTVEAYCLLARPKDAVRRLTPLLSANVLLESDVREAAYNNPTTLSLATRQTWMTTADSIPINRTCRRSRSCSRAVENPYV